MAHALATDGISYSARRQSKLYSSPFVPMENRTSTPAIMLAPIFFAALFMQACSAPEAVAFSETQDPPGGGIRRLPSAWTPTPSFHPQSDHTSGSPPTPTATLLPFMSGPEVIGYSVAGRPLEVYRFGNGSIRRLIVAGIHGGYEWNTIALAKELIAYLQDHPEAVPSEVTLFILPAFNPDGEARSHGYDGRANENGVDLNRNWPSHWTEEWPLEGCWNYLPISGGPAPVSEPEVAALMHFITSRDIEAIISYHSAALGIFAGGRPASEDSMRLAEAVAEVAPYPYPPLETGCDYTGQLADWASENGVPAIDVELTNHYDTDFEINLRVLEVFLNWHK